MPAGCLFGGTAGMEYSGAFARRQAGQFQFFEHGCRHGGNLRPVPDTFRCDSSRPANPLVSGVVFELEREEFDSQLVELVASRLPRRIPQEREKARGKI